MVTFEEFKNLNIKVTIRSYGIPTDFIDPETLREIYDEAESHEVEDLIVCLDGYMNQPNPWEDTDSYVDVELDK